MVGALSRNQKVAGSIPDGGAYDSQSRRVLEATNQCFSLASTFLSFSSSLSKSNEKKKCPQVRVKKKSDTCNMNVENIVLSDINQTENDNYCVIPFM